MSLRKLCLAILVSLLACSSGDIPAEVSPDPGDDLPSVDADGQVENQAPQVEITSPAEGAVFQAGDPVVFVAVVTDDQERLDQLAVSWISNLEGVLDSTAPNMAGAVVYETNGLVAGEHLVTLQVRDSEGASTEVARTIQVNAPPTAPVVEIEPASPGTLDDLNAILTTPPNDPNRAWEELSLQYTWYRDGIDQAIDATTVPAQNTQKGDIWQVRVRAHDGLSLGPEGTAQIVVANTAPTCLQAVLLPSNPSTEDSLTCSCTEWSDPDVSDEPDDRCEFLLDGGSFEGQAGECVLAAASMTKGQEIRCELTPSDGEADGESVLSEPVWVMNSAPPPPSSVTLTPSTATVETLLTCSATAEGVDPDGDSISLKTSWLVGEWENPGLTSLSVIAGSLQGESGASAVRGDAIRCRVRAFDGESDSSPTESLPVTLVNAAPQGGSVLVQPTVALEGDTLNCLAEGATDPDNDEVSWGFQWVVSEVPVVGATAAALTGEFFDKDDSVYCIATPGDGMSEGEPVASKVTVWIGNTPPTIESATLSPENATRAQEFECGFTGWEDVDPADTEAEVSFAWTHISPAGEETLLVQETKSTLLASGFLPGDTLRCQVTPMNGSLNGESVEAPLGTVINTAPALEAVILGPAGATTQTALVCLPEGFTDADGDTPSYETTWFVNQVALIDETGSSLTGGFQKGDAVSCSVKVSDGFDTAEPVSSEPVIIGNLPPIVGEVSLSPTQGSACELYQCTVESISDPDAQDVTVQSVQWHVNGVEVQATGETLTGVQLVPGDVIQCALLVSDGTLEEPVVVWSNPAEVQNEAPVVSGVAIEPIDPSVGTLLTCTWTEAVDPDCGVETQVSVRWTLNGEWLPGATGPTFDTVGIVADTEFTCGVMASDGFADGDEVVSETVTLLNVPPSAPQVTISAPQGADGTLFCAVLSSAVDTEPLSYEWFWQVGDAEAVSGEQSLPASAVSHCDAVRCWVEVNDGKATVDSNLAEMLLPFGADCADDEVCTENNCAPTGGCHIAPKPGPCDDEDLCTLGDQCSGGLCVSGSSLDCDDGKQCTTDGCDPASGCTNVPVAGSCDDGNACTTGDVCETGNCVFSGILDCDDAEPCTLDTCHPLKGCEHVSATAPCDDGSKCTELDTCAEGGCTGTPTDCDDDNVCTFDFCNPDTGCYYGPSGGSCDDGNACTTDDTCQAGACASVKLVQCDDDEVCTSDWCDPASGCEHAPNEVACEDGSMCTVGDTCADESCQSGALLNCSDGNDCTEDTCESLTGCLYKGMEGFCDDGNACTTGDHCADGLCTFLAALPCDDDKVCTTDSCDPQKGCLYVNNDAACDDDNACTVGESCVEGACSGGTALSCNDGESCTSDTCEAAKGCVYSPVSGACDDSDVCTTEDVCTDGVCVGGKALVCEDGNVCTADSCDELTGCVHTPVVGSCEDGNACTINDYCDPKGVCTSQTALPCADNTPCTTDTCHPASGCVFSSNNNPCEDGNPCTVGDVCAGGQCGSGLLQDCNDNNPCTDDSCLPSGLCNHTANVLPCNDGNHCTAGDSCAGSWCVGTPVVCDDGNLCTDDTCLPEKGCVEVFNAVACNDLNPCTVLDLCSNGLCMGSGALSCDDTNVCTSDQCVPGQGCVHSPLSGDCDDGNACTAGDQCQQGVCLSGPSGEAPAAPGAIQGNASPCSGAAGVSYSVTPDPTVTSYTWSLPDGATLVSGEGTASVLIDVGTSAGTLSVVATNGCGSSPPSTLSLSLSSPPASPAAITGPASPCTGALGVVYSVQAVPVATTYQWSLPSGMTMTAGEGTVAVTVDILDVTGSVAVSASNVCGASEPVSLAVSTQACLATGLIIPWNGGLTAVPTGWELCDGTGDCPDLRDRFVRGVNEAEEPGATGGTASHDHGGTDETALTTGSTHPSARSCGGNSCTWKTSRQPHSHTFDHSHTLSSAAHLPPYQEVLYLMNKTATQLPGGGMVHWVGDPSSAPGNWAVCDGSTSAPDLRGRFLKGASAGADAGGSGGAASHDHGGSTGQVSGTGSFSSNYTTVGCYGASATDGSHAHGYEHSHSVFGVEHLPPYRNVLVFEATAATGTPPGTILLWSQSLASIPSGWALADGTNGPDLRGRYTRGTPDGQTAGNAGGSATHNHGLSTDPGGTTSTNGGGNGNCGNGGNFMAFHSHSVPSHTHSVSEAANAPPFHALAYIIKL